MFGSQHHDPGRGGTPPLAFKLDLEVGRRAPGFGDKIRSARGRTSHIGRFEMMFIPAACPLEDRSWPEDVDAAKAMFMTEVARIVADGRGDITKLNSVTLELRLATGEIFHLGEQSVTRIA
jgi:hypothetical protein